MIISSDGEEINTVSSVTVISDQKFDQEVFGVEKPVLVYFWASWCGPCRLVSPSIDWVAKTYDERLKVVKLEIDPNPDSVAKYKVEGVPALRIFKDKNLLPVMKGRSVNNNYNLLSIPMSAN